MNILIYLEPVTYRDDPLMLSPHLSWIESFVRANLNSGVRFGIVTSWPLYSLLDRALPKLVTPFLVEQWSLLAPSRYVRHSYSKALYGRGEDSNLLLVPLVGKLSAARERFKPDLVLCSTQNVAVEQVFADVRRFFYEQAPLPRHRRKGSLVFDPFGHQVGSLINRASTRLLAGVPPKAGTDVVLEAWREAAKPRGPAAARRIQVVNALRRIAKGRKIAAFAMQPTDWITYEGAFEPVENGALIARWAERLPEGWIGVPFHHPSSRAPEWLDRSLPTSFPNLVTLPSELASNALDLAIDAIDGLVTISSTTAMTAALAGKRVVTVGASAFSALFGSRIEDLAEREPLSADVRANLIAVLTHRYCHAREDVCSKRGGLLALAEEAGGRDTDYFLDCSGWDPGRIAELI